MRLLFCVLCLCLLGCGQRPEATSSVEATSSGENNPVVLIKATTGNLTSMGNACVVNYHGRQYILTAYHVISDGGIITIWNNTTKLNVDLGNPRVLKAADVAIIPVTRGTLRGLELSSNAIQLDTSCSITGYTHSGVLETRTGIVKAIKLETTCLVERGLSGSPLIQNGQVVGVTTSIVTSTDSVTGLSHNGGGHISSLNFTSLME